ncbi:TRAF3-interacting JNK-activating modulator isoform X2 [Brienomyrus brachyistius]|uniref:TRAF3-interacting JNK-activating modulator isoform X2 n=1 Tax=Brienomyrus brachyistius TaxID=42636 RepID=UPI0020B437F2|nr:TRAF3-interacting JNK-activating modulator isoform X2 [Brienomyrus brachyistius]
MTPTRNTQRSKVAADGYDHKRDQRAAKHEFLRDRNNATTCRSPARQHAVEGRRAELQQKRQTEFWKRRQIEPTVVPSGAEEAVQKPPKVVLREKTCKANPLDRRSLVMAEDLGITWPDVTSIEKSPWLKPIHSRREKVPGREGASRSQHGPPGLSQHSSLERIRATWQTGAQRRDEGLSSQRPQRDSSAQTESGLITIRKSDLLQLADYLQEALWREENLKQKLAILQKSTSTLMMSSDKLWTTRCSEDLTRSRIETLEAQLELCTQEFRGDGVKKLVLQMEEQKQTYEERALEALQKAINEKVQAEKKAESLEEALKAALLESERWKSLSQQLKESSEELMRNQEQTTDRLHQLQSELERAKGQEADLRHQLWDSQQEGAELRSQLSQLEDDNQLRGEQLEEMRGARCDMWQACTPEDQPGAEPEQAVSLPPRAESDMEAQLQDTQQRLTLKENECKDLRADLEAVEHECHTCLFRLAQCREELRRLNARRRRSCGCSWLGLCFLMAVVMGTLTVVLLYQPVYGERLQEVCRSLRQRVESYMREAALPSHSGCYRPV